MMTQTTEQHRLGLAERKPTRDEVLTAAGVRLPDRSLSRAPEFAGKTRPWFVRMILRAFS
jgi:hypothetical protein